MRSFILALLPGLEEETGEFFDKVSVKRSRGIYRQFAILALGHCLVGSSVSNGFNIVLLPKHLACHAHDTLGSRNFTQLPGASSSATRGR
jgi:hypothetical protein